MLQGYQKCAQVSSPFEKKILPYQPNKQLYSRQKDARKLEKCFAIKITGIKSYETLDVQKTEIFCTYKQPVEQKIQRFKSEQSQKCSSISFEKICENEKFGPSF